MFPQVCFAQILPPKIPFPQKSRTPKCSSDTLKTTSVLQINSSDKDILDSGALEASCSEALLRGPCWEASRPLHKPVTQPEQSQACLPWPPKRDDSFCFCFIILCIYWGQGDTCHGVHRCRSQRISWTMDHAILGHQIQVIMLGVFSHGAILPAPKTA